MNVLGLRLLLVVLFIVFFAGGGLIGYLSAGFVSVDSGFGFFGVALAVIVVFGFLSMIEQRYVWSRYFYESFGDLRQRARSSGGTQVPISMGLGIGMFSGWFVGLHGLPI